jgi:hypothetical protein
MFVFAAVGTALIRITVARRMQVAIRGRMAGKYEGR